MKRFKIGFLAIAAIIAMSFTVADYSGAFKSKRSIVDGCYTSIPVASADCTTGTSSYPATAPNNGTSTPHFSTFDLCLGYVNEPTLGSSVTDFDDSGCPSGNKEVCCYEITTSGVTCCPQSTKFRIVNVWFKNF